MSRKSQEKFREFHRYLGFFLAGIMAVYAFSGIVLTFRNTDAFKTKTLVEKTIEAGLAEDELSGALNMRLTINKTEDGVIYFNSDGTYDIESGRVNYINKAYPAVLAKMNKLHLMNTTNPLFWLAIFFGISLMFFSISAFFMFNTGAPVYKKGLYFAFAGAVLTIVLLLV
ncbi:MAG: hypothetical protein RLZZ242_1359 [Bacteroidota bacterium]|jgi:hypothetical protein